MEGGADFTEELALYVEGREDMSFWRFIGKDEARSDERDLGSRGKLERLEGWRKGERRKLLGGRERERRATSLSKSKPWQ